MKLIFHRRVEYTERERERERERESERIRNPGGTNERDENIEKISGAEEYIFVSFLFSFFLFQFFTPFSRKSCLNSKIFGEEKKIIK